MSAFFEATQPLLLAWEGTLMHEHPDHDDATLQALQAEHSAPLAVEQPSRTCAPLHNGRPHVEEGSALGGAGADAAKEGDRVGGDRPGEGVAGVVGGGVLAANEPDARHLQRHASSKCGLVFEALLSGLAVLQVQPPEKWLDAFLGALYHFSPW